MAILKDATPPAMPESLTGDIDTLGIVSLAWKLGNEEDLMGYRVYRADHPQAEYIQITNAPIPGNFFMDTIPLNTLTKKVYYKVAAFDFNYNPSAYSTMVELKRPDYVPPVKPVLKGYKVKQDTVQLQFIASTSKDVVRHLVHRKEENGDWQILPQVPDSSGIFNDFFTNAGTTYSYAMEAIDEAGLSSGKSRPIVIKTSNLMAPSVTNVKGNFDNNNKTFTLNWEYNEKGSFKFIIYRSAVGEPLNVYGQVGPPSTNFTDRKFYRNEKGYIYAVKVLFSDGTESPLSETVTAAFKQ
jgi:fibronectin type 3 domain-containing protein